MTPDVSIHNAIVLPGSFNPIHDGHEEMVRIAAQNHPLNSIYLEITISNADKKEESWEDYFRRVREISKRRFEVIFSNKSLF